MADRIAVKVSLTFEVQFSLTGLPSPNASVRKTSFKKIGIT